MWNPKSIFRALSHCEIVGSGKLGYYVWFHQEYQTFAHIGSTVSKACITTWHEVNKCFQMYRFELGIQKLASLRLSLDQWNSRQGQFQSARCEIAGKRHPYSCFSLLRGLRRSNNSIQSEHQKISFWWLKDIKEKWFKRAKIRSHWFMVYDYANMHEVTDQNQAFIWIWTLNLSDNIEWTEFQFLRLTFSHLCREPWGVDTFISPSIGTILNVFHLDLLFRKRGDGVYLLKQCGYIFFLFLFPCGWVTRPISASPRINRCDNGSETGAPRGVAGI